jgi:hypothetical protein
MGEMKYEILIIEEALVTSFCGCLIFRGDIIIIIISIGVVFECGSRVNKGLVGGEVKKRRLNRSQ